MDSSGGNGSEPMPPMLAELAAMLARANENVLPGVSSTHRDDSQATERLQQQQQHASGFVRVVRSDDVQPAAPMAVTKRVPVAVNVSPPQQHIEQMKMLEQYYKEQQNKRIIARRAAAQTHTRDEEAPTVAVVKTKGKEGKAHGREKEEEVNTTRTRKRERSLASAPVPARPPIKQRKATAKSEGRSATGGVVRRGAGASNAMPTTKTTKPLLQKTTTATPAPKVSAPKPTSAAAGGVQSKVRSEAQLRLSLAKLLGGVEHVPELKWDRKRAFIVPLQTRECLLWTLCEKRLLAAGAASIDEATRRAAIDKSLEDEAQLFAKSYSKSSYKSLSLALIRSASSTPISATSAPTYKHAKHDDKHKHLSEKNQTAARAVREKLRAHHDTESSSRRNPP